MKKKIILLIVTLVLVVGAYSGYKHLYKAHRNIETEVAVMEVDAFKLKMFFKRNKTEEVLNKTVSVYGIVTGIEGNTITLEDMIQCSFDGELPSVKIDDQVSIKGRCIGYDDLFELVKMDQSTLTKK